MTTEYPRPVQAALPNGHAAQVERAPVGQHHLHHEHRLGGIHGRHPLDEVVGVGHCALEEAPSLEDIAYLLANRLPVGSAEDDPGWSLLDVRGSAPGSSLKPTTQVAP